MGHGLTVGGGARLQSGTGSDVSFLGLPGISRFEQKSYAVADLMVDYAINPRLMVSANLYNGLRPQVPGGRPRSTTGSRGICAWRCL